MQTVEDFLHSAHKLGIFEDVMKNMDIVKHNKNYHSYTDIVEDAYKLTIKNMELYTVETREWKSALVNKTEYTPDTQELIIEFNNGAKYLYKNFTDEKYQAFCNAESQGKYFLTEVRKQYNGTDNVIKLEIDEPSTRS